MRLYTIVNKYDDGYETFDRTGHDDTFSSREVAEQALQHLLDNELGEDGGVFGDYSCYIWEHETYPDLETWIVSLHS